MAQTKDLLTVYLEPVTKFTDIAEKVLKFDVEAGRRRRIQGDGRRRPGSPERKQP